MNRGFLDNTEPAAKILWDYVRPLIAYTTVTPLFFQGFAAGTEFLTYNAGKLYFALEFEISCQVMCNNVQGHVVFYNEANAISFYAQNLAAFYHSGNAEPDYCYNNYVLKNIYFSRMAYVVTTYEYIRFVGYRLDV